MTSNRTPSTPAPPELPEGARYVGTLPAGATLYRIVWGLDGMLDVEASTTPPDAAITISMGHTAGD